MAINSRDDRINELLGNKLKTPSDLSRVLMQALAEVAGLNSERSNILKRQLATILGQLLKLAALKLLAAMAAGASSAAMNTTSSMARNQRAALNALTQQVLRLYGIDPRRPNLNKSKTINAMPITRLTGNGTTKIENKTTYNNKTTNEIKIVQPQIPIAPAAGRALGDNGKLLKNWLNNQFMNLQHEIEMSKKDYNRHEINLARSTEKMMRKIEDASKRFAENMNPQKIARASADLMKIVMMTVAAHLIVAGFNPLKKVFSGINDEVRNLLGAGGKSDKRGIFKLVYDGMMDNARFIVNYLKFALEDRKKAIDLVLKKNESNNVGEFLQKSINNGIKNLLAAAGMYPDDPTANMLSGLGGSLLSGIGNSILGMFSGTSMIGQLMSAAIGGSGGLYNYTTRDVKTEAINNFRKGRERYTNFDGSTKNDVVGSYFNSGRASILNKVRLNDKGHLEVPVANVMAGINSLSKSSNDYTYLDNSTGKTLEKKVKGTIVQAQFLESILLSSDITRLLNTNKIYSLYSSSDFMGGVDGDSVGGTLWYATSAAAHTFYAGLGYAGDAITNVGKLDSLKNYNWGNSMWNKAKYAAKNIGSWRSHNLENYELSDTLSITHRFHVYLITKEGWQEINRLLGLSEEDIKQGKDLDYSDPILRDMIANRVARAQFGSDSSKYIKDIISTDEKGNKTLNADLLLNSEVLYDTQEVERLQILNDYYLSTGYRAVSNIGEGVSNAFNAGTKVVKKGYEKGKKLVVSAADYFEKELNYSNNNSNDAGNSSNSGDGKKTPVLSDKTVRERAISLIKYLKDRLNLTEELAAGIVGNLLGEDPTLDPGLKEIFGYEKDKVTGDKIPIYTKEGRQCPGRGIAQWTTKGNWDKILGHINEVNKKNYTDISQSTLSELAEALAWDLETNFNKGTLEAIRKSKSVDEAMGVFHRNYEILGRSDNYWTSYDKMLNAVKEGKVGDFVSTNIESRDRRSQLSKDSLTWYNESKIPSLDINPVEIETPQVLLRTNSGYLFNNASYGTPNSTFLDLLSSINLGTKDLSPLHSILNNLGNITTSNIPNIINVSQGGSSNTTIIANSQNTHRGAIVK